MKVYPGFLLLFIFLIFACQPQDRKAEKTFTSPEIGWTIDIPENFNPVSDQQLAHYEQKGKQAIETASGQQVETSQLRYLINFQKDQFNSLNATIQPFDGQKDGDYRSANEVTKKAIFDAYTAQKMKIDTSSFKNNFAGQPFNGFLIKIYAPDGGVMMHQLMLSQLRNGYDFAININYNNEQDATLMMDAVKKSKFSK